MRISLARNRLGRRLFAVVLAAGAILPVHGVGPDEEAGIRLLGQAALTIGGGTDAGIRSLQVDVVLSLTLGDRPVSLKQTVSYRPPDRIRQALETPLGIQVMVINGDRGYLEAGEQWRILGEEQIRGVREDLARELLLIVGNVSGGTIKAGAGEQSRVGDSSCRWVGVEFGGTLTQLCIDDAGYVWKQTYEGKHPLRGDPGRMEILFSDYRQIDGRAIPHQQELLFDGQPLGGVTLRRISVNPDLDPGLFEVPDGP